MMWEKQKGLRFKVIVPIPACTLFHLLNDLCINFCLEIQCCSFLSSLFCYLFVHCTTQFFFFVVSFSFHRKMCEGIQLYSTPLPLGGPHLFEFLFFLCWQRLSSFQFRLHLHCRTCFIETEINTFSNNNRPRNSLSQLDQCVEGRCSILL